MVKTYLRLSVDAAAWLFLAWTIFRKLQFYFFPSSQGLSRYKRTPQAYALITGASAGIGYAFAQELIGHGFGVILLASRKERLEAAAQRLRAENPNAAVKTVVWDAQDVDSDKLSAALKPIIDLPITVLVNNVGGIRLSPPFQSLTEYSPEDVLKAINLNSTFMARLTHLLIPVLNRNNVRDGKRSLVISISSGGYTGQPYMILYSACKGFVRSFAVALARESAARGWPIDSLGVIPGEVYSGFNNSGLSPGSPTAEQFVKCVLDRVDFAIDRKMWVVVPYWIHALQFTLLESLPEGWVQRLMVGTIKKHMQRFEKAA